MLTPSEIRQILTKGNPKQIKALADLMPLLTWTPRPNKPDLFDEQEAFLNNSDPGLMVAIGGTGSGKSVVGAVKTAKRVLTTEPPRDLTPWWVMSRNFEMASGNCWTQKLRQLIPASYIQSVQWYKKTKAQPQAVILKPFRPGANRWMIEFKSAESDLGRVMGTEVYGAWVDEYCPMEIFREVRARLRVREHDGSSATGNFFYTLTPLLYEPEFQDIYDNRHRYANGRADDYHFYHMNSELNSYLPTGYLEGIVNSELDELKLTRTIGAFCSFTGAIYPTFRPEVHVREPYQVPDDWHKVRAVDPGFSSKFACLWLAKDDAKQRWVVYDEYFREDQTYEDHAQAIKNRHPNFKGTTYIDPADPNGSYAFLRQGITTLPAYKAIDMGINEVRHYLKCHDNGEPRLHIFKHCERLIKEMRGYRWRPNYTTRPDPLKEDDDCVDALRYGIASEKDMAASYRKATPNLIRVPAKLTMRS